MPLKRQHRSTRFFFLRLDLPLLLLLLLPLLLGVAAAPETTSAEFQSAYKLAMEGGDSAAQFNLGLFYEACHHSAYKPYDLCGKCCITSPSPPTNAVGGGSWPRLYQCPLCADFPTTSNRNIADVVYVVTVQAGDGVAQSSTNAFHWYGL